MHCTAIPRDSLRRRSGYSGHSLRIDYTTGPHPTDLLLTNFTFKTKSWLNSLRGNKLASLEAMPRVAKTCQPCRPVGGAKFWARAILAPRPKYLGQRYTILQNFRPFGYDIFKIPTRQNQMWSWLRPKYLGQWYTILQTFRPFIWWFSVKPSKRDLRANGKKWV